MSKATLTIELPISAQQASELARKAPMVQFVLGPYLRAPGLKMPTEVGVGTSGSARLWWFGIIPSWQHHLEIVRLDDLEIATREHGGPVHTWNHRLTFVPIGDNRCRYTDEIETDDGVMGFLTRLFIRAMFRHRHRRWRLLAEILA